MKRLIIINLVLMILIYIIPIKEDVKNIQIATIQENRIVETVSSRSLEEPRQDEEIALKQTTIENKATEISQEGINLIKQFEGLKLHSYRLEGEQHYTIRFWT